MLKKILLGLLGIIALTIAISGFVLTRDGELKTPTGSGVVTVATGEFEAFPLPDYAADFVDDAYKSYLVEVAPGIKMHVLEVGTGYPVYLQHGAPTSGLLYRKVAAKLPLDQFRVIMPTLVGLGFSSKIPASQHSVEGHITWVSSLLNKLGVDRLIFAGHDWGGPIGMGALARSPDLMQGAVILNTVLDAPKIERDVSVPLMLARLPVVGEFLFEGPISMFSQLPSFQHDPASMPPEVIALYENAVQDSGNSKGPLAMVRMAVTSPDHPDVRHFRNIETYLQGRNVPAEIVWGMNDPILGGRLGDMKGVFPDAKATETDGGHFLQEETPEEIADAIMRVRVQVE